jgi:hypothetical protein
MHIPILSERQKHRALRTLLEVEALHVAQCECPDRCDMLRRLREDINELKAHLSQRRSVAKKCRDFSRSGKR